MANSDDRKQVPDVLWHGCDVERPNLENPNILGTHFGTIQAAQQRLEVTGRGVNSWVLPYRLTVMKPLALPDLGVWSFQSVTRELRLLKIVTAAQVDQAYEAWNRSDAEGWSSIREAIQAAGFDSISYVNEIEDAGSVSWIILDAAHAVVLDETDIGSSTNPGCAAEGLEAEAFGPERLRY